MTVIAIAAALALAPPAVIETKAKSASLFKNGYAVVVREAPISGSGEFLIENVPTAVMGTFWITADPGVRIREAVMTNVETRAEANVESLDEALNANVGRTLKFFLGSGTELTGKLLSATGPILVIQTQNETRILQKGLVTQISSAGGDIVWKTTKTTQKRALRLKVTAEKPAMIYLVGLERGLTWSPAYSVEMLAGGKLELTSKATVLNDLVDLTRIEVRLITGFPNIPFLAFWDPFTMQQSVDQFINTMMQLGTPDQYRRDGAKMMMQNAAPSSFGGAFESSPLLPVSEEDLFFYRLANVTLKRGDRGYYILFETQSSYEHIYEWQIPDRINETRYVDTQDVPGDVWHSLKFKNTSANPLTTGPATVFKNGEILGQDMLNYTSAGAETTVRITKALDIRADDAEEEVSREALENPLRGSWYDLITLKGTLQVHNRKSESVKLQITKYLTGEMVSADGSPEIKSIAKGLRAVNPRQQLRWTVTLKPDEKLTLTYTYKVYLNR